MASEILIVDDEADIRDLVAGILQDEGYVTRTARNSDDALSAIVARRPNLLFLDIWLQGSKLDGLQLLEAVKQEHADLPVVMISGHGNIETAVAAIKLGAYDFIEKPFKADRLVLVADRALENSRLKREVRQLKQLAPIPSTLVGRSAVVGQLRQAIERVAPTNSRVLVVGPSGAGKELAARTLHQQSGRASGPFVVINAAAITPERMEIELFGVDQSNGAEGRKAGALEEAHGGTLFVDDIAELPRETQNKILRVLVDQTFQRVGGSTRIAVDVRIVSSTARNLEALIAEGKFREDLYHRLAVVPIRVPPLAERREDIPDLVEYFMDQISQATGLPKRRIGDDAMAVLQSHNWPGNVRQLRNNIERLMILAGGDPEAVMNASMLPPDVVDGPEHAGRWRRHLMGLPLRDARNVRARYLARRLAIGGNIAAAEFVGMERSALHRKLRLLDRLAGHVTHCVRQRPLCAARPGKGRRRGSRISIRGRRLRGLRGEGRPHDRREPPHGAARSIAQGTTDLTADVASCAGGGDARNDPAKPGPRWDYLPAGHPRRCETRFSVSGREHTSVAGRNRAQQ
jgi:two-component system nitrogen regulation response regulator NtrX